MSDTVHPSRVAQTTSPKLVHTGAARGSCLLSFLPGQLDSLLLIGTLVSTARSGSSCLLFLLDQVYHPPANPRSRPCSLQTGWRGRNHVFEGCSPCDFPSHPLGIPQSTVQSPSVSQGECCLSVLAQESLQLGLCLSERPESLKGAFVSACAAHPCFLCQQHLECDSLSSDSTCILLALQREGEQGFQCTPVHFTTYFVF